MYRDNKEEKMKRAMNKWTGIQVPKRQLTSVDTEILRKQPYIHGIHAIYIL